MSTKVEHSRKYFPLTHSQKGIWYSEKLYPDTSMGNIAATLRFQSNVNFSLLEQALNIYIKKNDAVRIRIAEIAGEPRQYVTDYTYRKFELIDFSDKLDELYKWDEKQTRTPMEIIESDLFSFVLIKINDHDGGFFVKFHHLISDAWTMSLLGNYVMEYYSALKKGEPIPEDDKPSFIDYIENDKYKESTRYQKDKAYWEEKFEPWQEVTSLKNRKTGNASTRARRKTLLIPQKLTAKIHEYCSQKKVSEFNLFLAAICMYVTRVTGKEDLVFGTTFLNRSKAKEKDTAGFFANVAVPLRFYIKDNMNFNDFVESVSKEVVTALRHQKYPYDELLKTVREKKGTKDGLFDIVLTYQNSKFIKDQGFEKYITRWHFNGHQLESLIINLNDRESDGRLIIDYDYLTDLFYVTEIEFIHNHLISLLWHALDNPVKLISKLEILSEKEKQKILHKFNDTDAEFPRNKLIQQLFEEQVIRTPANKAVLFRDQCLTYRELNERSNQLARVLLVRGVKPDSVVGIKLERSLEMVIGIFAILKAGGAYLPIDPKAPQDRVKYMLDDCSSHILLTDSVQDNMELGVDIIDLGDPTLYTGDNTNIQHLNKPTDLAYVIYTSGSTGKPKGVMIEHRSLINRINWMQKKYPLDENSVILQKTTYTFDVSVWELIWWSFVGAKVCMLEPEGEKDPLAIIKAIEKYGVTTMHFVPSMLSLFLNFLEKHPKISKLSSLKQVFASGEALNIQQVERFNTLLNAVHGTELANLYGPTEAAIDVTSFDCSPKVELTSVPIGRPIDNIKLYILDKHLTLLPIGIPGELFIGGVGVARGYINKADLTEEKFVDNPYSPGEKMYRTGDLARWYSQGDIEYLGRLDHQVKIRGFRIELGEIENRMLDLPGIKEAVVTGAEIDDMKHLCAYYVSDHEIPDREIKRSLATSLPEYMVPSYIIRMDALPLSANGKIDRKVLPQPQISQAKSQSEFAPPRNEVDEELLEIIQEVLKIDRIGIDDSLFDLGGDSLTVIMVISRIYDRNWGITAADFYQYPTIRELSDKISGPVKTGTAITPMDVEVMEIPEAENVGDIRDVANVLLTGATGFLGIHILSELLEYTDSSIYCLVRAASDSYAKDRLKDMLNFYFGDKYDHLFGSRIFTIKGDVSSSSLELSADDYHRLGQLIDTIVHSAAMVKYYGDYTQIEKTNVSGTRTIVDFAKEFDIKLNHISTVSVTGNYLVNNQIGGSFSEKDLYVGQSFMDNIYVRSKFEAEKIVLKAVGEGLKATIFRMGNLTGRYHDGHFQQNIGENAFYSVIRSILELGAISGNLTDEKIEFSPVDFCARAVTGILKTSGSDNRIFHIFNHRTIEIKRLINEFEALGIYIRILDQKAMDSLVKESSGDMTKRQALLGLVVYLNETGELAHSASINISSDLSQKYLYKLGFEWPEVDKAYLSRLLHYMRKTSYLSAM